MTNQAQADRSKCIDNAVHSLRRLLRADPQQSRMAGERLWNRAQSECDKGNDERRQSRLIEVERKKKLIPIAHDYVYRFGSDPSKLEEAEVNAHLQKLGERDDITARLFLQLVRMFDSVTNAPQGFYKWPVFEGNLGRTVRVEIPGDLIQLREGKAKADFIECSARQFAAQARFCWLVGTSAPEKLCELYPYGKPTEAVMRAVENRLQRERSAGTTKAETVAEWVREFLPKEAWADLVRGKPARTVRLAVETIDLNTEAYKRLNTSDYFQKVVAQVVDGILKHAYSDEETIKLMNDNLSWEAGVACAFILDADFSGDEFGLPGVGGYFSTNPGGDESCPYELSLLAYLLDARTTAGIPSFILPAAERAIEWLQKVVYTEQGSEAARVDKKTPKRNSREVQSKESKASKLRKFMESGEIWYGTETELAKKMGYTHVSSLRRVKGYLEWREKNRKEIEKSKEHSKSRMVSIHNS